MKRTWMVFLIFLVVFGYGLITKTGKVLADDPILILNEFMVNPSDGQDEWIEILNLNTDSALDLTGYRLVINQGAEPDYDYHYSQDLSGSVPKGGFLTFAVGNGTTVPDEGGCMIIFRTDTESVYAVKYGNGTCDDGADEQDATGVAIEQGKSIYYSLDEETWNLGTSPSKGWCNPGDEGICPTIATIVSQMEGDGVTTNLGDQTDFSRITDLYFQKSEGGQTLGRITFLAEMNFTDIDALAWLGVMDSNLSISQGVIDLNADLIKNLTSTQATLTMYNITLNNPTISVTNTDGSAGDSGIVSGLTYDQTAHTLTFTAAHFTTFMAVENTGTVTNNSTSSSGPAGCGDWKPMSIPNLFQIDTSTNSATLYFTPVTDHLTYYYVAFGHKQGDWQYGGQFSSNQKIGVVSLPINYLSPNTTYYFQVRGGNGCATGDWSNALMVKTSGLAVSQTEVDSVPVEEKVVKKTLTPQPEADPPLVETLIKQEVQEVRETIKSEEVIENEKESVWQKIDSFFKSVF